MGCAMPWTRACAVGDHGDQPHAWVCVAIAGFEYLKKGEGGMLVLPFFVVNKDGIGLTCRVLGTDMFEGSKRQNSLLFNLYKSEQRSA